MPMQIVVGDLHGLNTLEHQPAKIAAIEAIWQTERGVPLMLFAHARTRRRGRNRLRDRACRRLGSLILTHDLDGEIKGLDDFRDDHPPVAPLFFAFRIMVGHRAC